MVPADAPSSSSSSFVWGGGEVGGECWEDAEEHKKKSGKKSGKRVSF